MNCILYILIPSEDALRVDANISVRHTNADKLGTRTEVKNIQSWKSLSKAIGKIYVSHINTAPADSVCLVLEIVFIREVTMCELFK